MSKYLGQIRLILYIYNVRDITVSVCYIETVTVYFVHITNCVPGVYRVQENAISS